MQRYKHWVFKLSVYKLSKIANDLTKKFYSEMF